MLLACVTFALAFAPMAPMGRRSVAVAPRMQVSMATIAASDVKKLREKTGAGMMDCKGALAECNGDMEAAADMLRAKGLAAAGKRSNKATSEGMIEVYIHTGARLGVLVEVRGRRHRQLAHRRAICKGHAREEQSRARAGREQGESRARAWRRSPSAAGCMAGCGDDG
jgi:hypothetical protein